MSKLLFEATLKTIKVTATLEGKIGHFAATASPSPGNRQAADWPHY